MALSPPPKFHGSLVITASSNDTIHWRETNGVTPVDLTTVIAPATYWPSALASAIATAMTNESTASGYGATYTVTISDTDGTVTISGSGGTLVEWILQLTTTETQKLLTGGDVAVDSQGAEHFGWTTDGSYPSGDASFASDTAHDHSWYPDQPPQADDLAYESSVSEVLTMGGRQVVRDWSGDPTQLYQRTLTFELINQASRDQYDDEFWPYAKDGSSFRYFADRTSVSYVESVLTGGSLRRSAWDRVAGYQWYRGPVMIRPKVS